MLVSLDKTTFSSYPITYDMWLFYFSKTIKHSPEHSLFHIPDVQGLEPPPLRLSKLSVVELSRKNSRSLSNSSRDWYRVLLFDAAMRDELPYFSDIDNI